MAFDDLPIFRGTMLGRKHRVEALLGEGGFGLVTKCRNLETGKLVAVKVCKDGPSAAQDTRKEIDILRRLRCLDPDTCNIVRSFGFFSWESLTCLVFELLDQSLYDYMTERRNRGLSISELRPIMHQLATALKHLSSIGLVHADLKPENIMVVDRRQQPLQVKIIDFGLAHPVSAAKTGVCLQTQWYRAPEIMLASPYTEAIDMWSLGLVAAEMATGYPLYPGETNYDVLRFIIETQGQPADYVLGRGEQTGYFFDYLFDYQDDDQRWTLRTPEEFASDTGYYAEETRYAKLTCLDDLLSLMSGGQQSDQHMLVDLIKRMLQLDADQRIKPLEVLQHPFFGPSSPQSDHVCTDTVMERTDADQQQPPCGLKEPEISQDSVERKTVSPAVQVEDLQEVDIDVSMDTDIALADADHQQPPCCLRGPEISQDSVQTKIVPQAVLVEDPQEVDIDVSMDTDIQLADADHQQPPCCLRGPEISQDSVQRTTVSPAVLVEDPQEVDIDVCMDTDIELADEDHQQPPCCLRGPEISQDSVQSKSVSPTVEAEDTDFEDIHVQNAGCFGHFFRMIRKAFRKRRSRMSS